MSDKLNEFRTQNPAYSEWSDDDLAHGLYEKFYKDKISRQEYNQQIGYKGLSQDQEGVSFLEAMKAGVSNLGGAGKALKAGVADLFGNEEAEMAAIAEFDRQKNRTAKLLEGATDWRDIADADSIGEGFSRTLDFVKEQLGLNSPQMATIIAGGFGGAKIAPHLPNPLATGVSKLGGFATGSALVALPMFTGFNLGRQIDEGQDPDIVKAGAYAIPQAAAEALLAGVFSKTGITSLGSKVLGETSESMIGRVGQKVGEALAIGVPGEVIQQGLERASADLEVDPWASEEAFNEYLDAAFSAMATLAPMGTVAAIPGGIKDSNKIKRQPKDVQDMLKEEVLSAKEPAQNIFKTPEEASSGLISMGYNPEMFTPEAQIKAANLLVDKIDNNRNKFFQSLVPQGSNLQSFLTRSTAMQPISRLTNQKQEVPSRILENTKISDIAKFIPIGPSVIPSIKIDPIINTEASTGLLIDSGRVVAERRNNLLRGPEIASKPTFTDVSGQIVADLELFGKESRKVLNGPKKDIIKIAKEQYNIPEASLKDETGQFLPKQDIVELVNTKRLENASEFKPKVKIAANQDRYLQRKPKEVPLEVTPLERIGPEGIDAIVSSVTPLRPSPEVTSRMKPVVEQMKRISKEVNTNVDIEADLKVDVNTKQFNSPIKAAQAGNYLFTVANLNNVVDYPNIDSHLQEVWEYSFDKLSKETQENLFKDIPVLNSTLEQSDGIHTLNLEYWSKGTLGKRELLSYLFADYIGSVRKSEKPSVDLTRNVKREFDRVLKGLEKSKSATRGLGLNTFESIFPQVAEQGVTPRDAVFESIDRLRYERLKSLSDEMQFEHWDNLDRVNIRKVIDENIKNVKDKEAIKGNLGKKLKDFYSTSMLSSITHAASKHPLVAIAFNLRREQETLQAQLMNKFSDKGETFFREGSKEVRTKAADVMDLLRNTNQSLTKDAEGALVFQRDGKIVRIANKDMINVIESLHSWGQSILETAEGDVRSSINDLIPDSMMSPVQDIKNSIEQIEQDKSLSNSDIDFLKDQLETLENLRNLRGKPFMPHMRFGPFGFTVHAKENIKDGKVKPNADPVFHAQVEKGNYKGRWDKEQYIQVQKDLNEYRNNKNFVIFEDSKNNPFEMTYDNMYDKVARDNVTLEMLSGLLGTDKSQEYFVDVKQKLDNKTRFRGYRKRFGESKDIKGYSTDWDRVVSSYNMGAAHFFSKARYAPLLQEYATNVESQLNDEVHGRVKKQTLDYIDYTNSPHDSWQMIRTVNFLWTMGGNFSTAMLQYMTLPTTSLGSMAHYNPNPYQNMRSLQKNFNIAFNELPKVSQFENGSFIMRMDDPKFMNALKNKHKFSDDEIRFVKQMFVDGRTGAAFLEEQTGNKDYDTRTISGKTKEGAKKFSQVLGSPIGAMEQATRFATAMAHYQMFKNNPKAVERALKILENDARFQTQRKLSNRSLIEDLTYFGVDEAHAVFGKIGRGGLLRGGMGAFVFPFMTYPQNAVEFMARMAGRGPEGKKALITTAGALFLFSGLIGLPGGELFKELYEEAYKFTQGEEIDLDYLIREKLTEATGDPRAGMFVTQGAFRAFLNMDVSRRIGLPIVGQDLLLSMMGVRGDMSDLLGVQGSMLSQGISAWGAYKQDESGLKVGSLLSPVAISNVLKAASYHDEGIRTSRGTQLVTPEYVKENPTESIMRAIGITTGKVASAREAQYWKMTENRKIKPKMDSFRAKGKNILTKQYQAAEKGDSKLADKYKNQYNDLIKDLVEFLKEKEMPYDLASFNRSVLDAVDQRITAGIRYEDLNKNVRHRKEVIDRVSGTDLYE